MKNAIICDTVAMMMVNMLAELEASEPADPSTLGESAPYSVVEEAGRLHYEWYQQHRATMLMLSARLVGLAREQLIE